jgi:hypothetical protein
LLAKSAHQTHETKLTRVNDQAIRLVLEAEVVESMKMVEARGSSRETCDSRKVRVHAESQLRDL